MDLKFFERFTELEKHIVISVVDKLKLKDVRSVVLDCETLKNGGFCSTLKIVQIYTSEQDLNLVLKLAPINAELRKTIPFDLIFARELFFYDKVLKDFSKLETKFNIPDRFENIPKCYFTSDQPLSEALVLENLCSQDFSLWDKSLPMTNAHIKLVLKVYAKFHALSFAMRKHAPEVLKEISAKTEDIYMNITESCGTTKVIEKLSRRVLERLEVEDVELAKKFHPVQEKLIEIMKECVRSKKAREYGVLCHGDNWCNNMLFKYEDENHLNPSAVKLLDWQLIRFGSPILDLSYFIFTSANKEAFEDLYELLNYYHDNLSNYLRNFFCDIKELFPFEILKKHWKEFAKFGLGMAFLVINVMLMDNSELPDVGEEKQSNEEFINEFGKLKDDSKYMKRMKIILQHFDNYGLW